MGRAGGPGGDVRGRRRHFSAAFPSVFVFSEIQTRIAKRTHLRALITTIGDAKGLCKHRLHKRRIPNQTQRQVPQGELGRSGRLSTPDARAHHDMQWCSIRCAPSQTRGMIARFLPGKGMLTKETQGTLNKALKGACDVPAACAVLCCRRECSGRCLRCSAVLRLFRLLGSSACLHSCDG